MNGNPGRACLAVLVGALVCLSAVACGGDDAAAPKPKFSSSPASRSPASTPPAAVSSSAPVDETAEDFVRRWNLASTKMQNTGDTSQYRSISQGCSACSKTADLVDSYYKAGGYVRTKGWRIKDLTCKAPQPETASCVAQIRVAPTTYAESSNGPNKDFSGGPAAEYFEMAETGGVWNMTYIAAQAQ